ncbi:hypothetical protein PSTT_03092 [Puccinia striiformis]|uniref:Uncharacterized protein n=1 Tax=Puccinia striiformis TaxID=27350 RepID=A0A2S4VXM1_9BASI|nr:hypothetical protein PSTT_03092 [Puccinia striiformis]
MKRLEEYSRSSSKTPFVIWSLIPNTPNKKLSPLSM